MHVVGRLYLAWQRLYISIHLLDCKTCVGFLKQLKMRWVSVQHELYSVRAVFFVDNEIGDAMKAVQAQEAAAAATVTAVMAEVKANIYPSAEACDLFAKKPGSLQYLQPSNKPEHYMQNSILHTVEHIPRDPANLEAVQSNNLPFKLEPTQRIFGTEYCLACSSSQPKI